MRKVLRSVLLYSCTVKKKWDPMGSKPSRFGGTWNHGGIALCWALHDLKVAGSSPPRVSVLHSVAGVLFPAKAFLKYL